MMTAPTAAMATPPLSLLAFLGDVAIFTLVALATERAEAEFAIAGAAISDDAIRPAIRNFKRMSNIPFEKQVGRRYHCHCELGRASCRENGVSTCRSRWPPSPSTKTHHPNTIPHNTPTTPHTHHTTTP